MAVHFFSWEIISLVELIREYFNLRKAVQDKFENYLSTLKPKHHFLTHYPSAIEKFGPPITYWTGHMESRHRLAKNIAGSAKNFINISYTLSDRQQKRQASIYSNGMFDVQKIQLPKKVTEKKDLQTNTEVQNSIN